MMRWISYQSPGGSWGKWHAVDLDPVAHAGVLDALCRRRYAGDSEDLTSRDWDNPANIDQHCKDCLRRIVKRSRATLNGLPVGTWGLIQKDESNGT